MLSLDGLIAVCVLYVLGLFAIAFWAEKSAQQGRATWLNSPITYTLSLSIYATAWTFYGAVGSAARSGLEFLTIYLGPTLVFVGWFWVLRKVVRIGRAQRVTSIADMISSRYGKSGGLAALVTVLAVVGTTPYIALQLQSVTLSFSVFAQPGAFGSAGSGATAAWLAAGLALFTIIFGTRSLDLNERHPGLVSAIAFEAIVKLAAILAVGSFVVWGVADGPADMLARIEASAIAREPINGARWLGLTVLAGAAILCLPRMFQVLVVENSDERHLAVAGWAFPLYLMLISLFVVPIAVAGMSLPGTGDNPDLYVLTVPLSLNQDALALLVFLGGFSAATSMVIVAALALSTMVSNHIVVPLWLQLNQSGKVMGGDMRRVALMARRVSIAGVLLLGLLYYRQSGGTAALASIGLISFLGVAQVLPALMGGILWRGATRVGAALGIGAGFAIWGWLLLLPNVAETGGLIAPMLLEGPFGIAWLSPATPLGLQATDSLLTAMVLSLGVNTALFILGSLFSFPSPLERLQGAQFVNVFDHSRALRGWRGAVGTADDLLIMAQRIMGSARAGRLFADVAEGQGRDGDLPEPTPEFLERLERELAGSVGAATAHAMVAQITGAAAVSVRDLLAVADETAQIMEYSSQLEAKSEELAQTARRLREANAKLTELSVQKDAFLSQISHELRTPMTSIRAFSEILMQAELVDDAAQARFSRIIHDESLRLTRLLDDLLDLSVLENGRVTLNMDTAVLADVMDRAISAAGAEGDTRLIIKRDRAAEKVDLWTDADRLSQVFINLISNAQKYCDAEAPELTISVVRSGQGLAVEFVDNGSGIPARQEALIFEKFARLDTARGAPGAGLGLAISREVMTRLDGKLSFLPGPGGARFRVTLPMAALQAA
ncbi:sodium:solute symporter [Rhodobacteraceae bacterium N5(2021)]|uniref:histidine kinase n=1 Tax=Gymnodinialimonas phycosphaerae TaxID=2841589 RepID=A0A975YH94_9RHOB|nr:ATP-binding protein [Gymnodinialimonas phycosphaerae]MBY4892545.1 sodium:solute symporter [Gymnodinialimonas phycosphaerae]